MSRAKTSTQVQCIVCGKVFLANRYRDRKYCSRTCTYKGFSLRMAGQDRQGDGFDCRQCGKHFYDSPSMGRKYCSCECARAARRNGVPCNCLTCGELFYARPGAAARQRGLYCSRACFHSGRQGIRADKRSGRYKPCTQCGTLMYAHPCLLIRKRFCSRLCAQSHLIAHPAQSPTRLEIGGMALLDELGVTYLPQVVIGRYRVDVFIPSHRTVVQFDGDYWHGYPAMFPAPNAVQRQNISRDRAHDRYMEEQGFPVIRIWEHDFTHNRSAVIDRLRHLATP